MRRTFQKAATIHHPSKFSLRSEFKRLKRNTTQELHHKLGPVVWTGICIWKGSHWEPRSDRSSGCQHDLLHVKLSEIHSDIFTEIKESP